MFSVIVASVLLIHRTDGNMQQQFMTNLNISTENWTDCDEFLNNTVFDVDSVVDVDWKIFYFWSTHSETSYHIRFSRPSDVLLDRFRLELKNDIQPPVNWTHSELFLETSIDLSGLFIKTNVSGKYRLIPSFAFRLHVSPYMDFAMKIVDEYLGMMSCKQKLVYALSPVDRVPSPLKIDHIAERFNVRNPHGRSYLTKSLPFEDPLSLQQNLEEVDDYAQVEMSRDLIF